MLFKIIVARTEMLGEWGWGKNARETAAFQTVTAARITHCSSGDRQLFELFSVKGNLGTCPVRILVASWCACVQIRLCLKSGRK